MWPLTNLAWYRKIDGHEAERVFWKFAFYVGVLICASAFFAIYYNRDGDGGSRRKSPVPEGPLTVPQDFIDKFKVPA